MVKIGVVRNFPIYLDKNVLFMKHEEKQLLMGKFFYKLSNRAQQTLVDRNITEILKDNRSKIRLNIIYVEVLKEMYTILKEENNTEHLEEKKRISDEYLSLRKTINSTILSR